MIKVSKSCLDQREADAVSDVILKSGYLGMGTRVQDFEKAVGTFLSTDRHVIAVATGTAALHLSTEAICPPGSEVLVPSLTFVASFQAVAAAGCVPVACEIDATTGLIDLADAEKRVTGRTAAIMPVHYAGQVADAEGVMALALKFKLRVIEDAAHSFGGTHGGRKVGSFGDVTCFSFDGIKNVTCGEGGAVVTNDPVAAQRIRDARLLGIEKDTEKRFLGERSWSFDVKNRGFRYHMNNVMAAIGLVQLDKAEALFAARRELAAFYEAQLSSFSAVKTLPLVSRDIVPHIYPIRVLDGKREALKASLAEQGVETGIHYYPSHMLSYFKREGERLPVTEKFYQEILTLPLHPGISGDEAAYVIKSVKAFFQSEARYV